MISKVIRVLGNKDTMKLWNKAQVVKGKEENEDI